MLHFKNLFYVNCFKLSPSTGKTYISMSTTIAPSAYYLLIFLCTKLSWDQFFSLSLTYLISLLRIHTLILNQAFPEIYSANNCSNLVDRDLNTEHQQTQASWFLPNGSVIVQEREQNGLQNYVLTTNVWNTSLSKIADFAIWECSDAVSKGRLIFSPEDCLGQSENG